MSIGFSIIGFSDTYLQVVSGELFCGLGVGLIMPNANLWVINLVPIQSRGKYLGGITTATFLRMFLSPIIVQPIQNAVEINARFLVLNISLLLTVVYLILRKKDHPH